MKKKQTNLRVIYISILVILFIGVSYAISIEDLVGSYNFSNTRNNIQILNTTIISIDANNNSLYDKININFDIDSKEYGTFDFNIELYSDNKLKTQKKFTKYLSKGNNQISVNLSSQILTNRVYNLSLEIYKDGILEYKSNNEKLIYLDLNKFEQNRYNIEYSNYSIQKTNNNTDLIKINFMTQVPQIGNYTATIIAKVGKQNIQKTKRINFTDLNQDITFELDVKDIKQDNLSYLNIPYVEITNQTQKYFIFPNKTIDLSKEKINSSYSYLANKITHELIDSNKNNLYDYLIITQQINIKKIGLYDFNLLLTDDFNNVIQKTHKSIKLNKTGLQNISFQLKGQDIYKKKIDGNYKIKTISMFYNNISQDSKVNTYNLGSYTHESFEKQNLPDLNIADYNYNNKSLIFNIQNIGQSDAFGITLKVFDDKFNTLYEELIPYILKDQNISKNIIAINKSKPIVFIDYYNTQEELSEKNNIAPRNEEVNVYNISGFVNILDYNLIEIILKNIGNSIIQDGYLDINNKSLSNLTIHANKTLNMIIEDDFEYDKIQKIEFTSDNINTSINFTIKEPQISIKHKILEQKNNEIIVEYTIQNKIDRNLYLNINNISISIKPYNQITLIDEFEYSFPIKEIPIRGSGLNETYSYVIPLSNNASNVPINSMLLSFKKIEDYVYEAVFKNTLNTTQFLEFTFAGTYFSTIFDIGEEKTFLLQSMNETTINYVNYKQNFTNVSLDPKVSIIDNELIEITLRNPTKYTIKDPVVIDFGDNNIETIIPQISPNKDLVILLQHKYKRYGVYKLKISHFTNEYEFKIRILPKRQDVKEKLKDLNLNKIQTKIIDKIRKEKQSVESFLGNNSHQINMILDERKETINKITTANLNKNGKK